MKGRFRCFFISSIDFLIFTYIAGNLMQNLTS